MRTEASPHASAATEAAAEPEPPPAAAAAAAAAAEGSGRQPSAGAQGLCVLVDKADEFKLYEASFIS